MKVGDMVRAIAGTRYRGIVGIIIDDEPRWPEEPREEDVLFEVFYTDGSLVKWAERNLEVINESR